jgi:putative phage-type endonuclease
MPRLSARELAERRKGMGSTDVVEALGLAPWEGAGPMRVFLAKTGPEPDVDERPELDWGHVMEPVILDWYKRETGLTVRKGGQCRHPIHSWLWASTDAHADGRIVEIKNVGANMAKHWDVTDDAGIPRYVRAQVTIAMWCSGEPLCDVVASIGGRPPHIWTVAYDDELARLLVDKASSFWADCTMGKAPPLDATDSTIRYLRAKYPTVEDRSVVEPPIDVEAMGQERARLTLELRAAESRVKQIDADLLGAIGSQGVHGFQGAGWRMTWNRKSKRFTVQGEE